MLSIAIVTGKKHVEVVANGQTVDSERYVSFVKNMMSKFGKHASPLTWTDAIIFQDNARHHTSERTMAFLESKSATLLNQPPYSPDFNICDRYRFNYLKDQRMQTQFEDDERVKNVLNAAIRSISLDSWEHE